MSDVSPTPVVGLKNDGTIVYTNQAFANLLGFDNSIFKETNIKSFCSDEILQSDFFKKFNCDYVYHNEEFELLDTNKTSLNLLISSSRSFDAENNPLIYLFIRNITSLKKTENLLAYLHYSSEELSMVHDLKSALEVISKIIVPVFADWIAIDTLENEKIINLKLVNDNEDYVAWAQDYRKAHDSIKDNNPTSPLTLALTQGKATLISFIDEVMIDEAIKDKETAQIFKNLNLQASIVVPIIVKEEILGAISFASSNAAKKYDEIDLRFAQMFANRVGLAFENIRLLEDAKREIKLRIKAEKKKNEFINVASHELKTPLTALKASIQLVSRMSENNDSTERIKSLLDKANNSVAKLSKLIDDLLNVSKIERERFKLDKTEFIISEMLNGCCDHIRAEGTHEIIVDGDLELKVVADKFKIEQVIVNLANNAVKHAPASKKILFTIKNLGDYAKISVKDYGPGIPDNKVINLFNRYYQVEDDDSNYSGMGLGLYISEKIVNRHEGKMGVETELGKGTTFWFTLPLKNNE